MRPTTSMTSPWRSNRNPGSKAQLLIQPDWEAMRMRRREFLLAGASGLATALAGCQEMSSAPTQTPTPVGSVLRIRVENGTNRVRSVSFQLDVRTAGSGTASLFRLEDIHPGATRRTERALAAGRYELRVTFDGDGTTVRWAGNECVEKLVVIRFSTDGFIISDVCRTSLPCCHRPPSTGVGRRARIVARLGNGSGAVRSSSPRG